jgi:hypothetical protein
MELFKARVFAVVGKVTLLAVKDAAFASVRWCGFGGSLFKAGPGFCRNKRVWLGRVTPTIWSARFFCRGKG